MKGTTMISSYQCGRIQRLPSRVTKRRRHQFRPLCGISAAETTGESAWENETGQPGSSAACLEEDLRIPSSKITGDIRQFEFELSNVMIRIILDANEGDSLSSFPYFLLESASLLQTRFQRLATAWKNATGHLSNIRKKCTHPAYQEIIGMGTSAIGLILNDLKQSHDDWFVALTTITGENPISEQGIGNVAQMAEAWLQWGRTKGYNV